MTTTRPEDVAALFGLAPPEAAPSPAPDTAAIEAAEAALAAEIAATIESGGFAADAPDSRTNPRVDVAWPARLRLPDGRVIELQVRNVSDAGMGLMSDEHIPADTVVDFEMDVPPLEPQDVRTVVNGTIRTTYTVARGAHFSFGGSWEVSPASLGPVNAWIRRLRR
jgi:hypothetical protein